MNRQPEYAEKPPARKPARGALKSSPKASSPRRRRGHRCPLEHMAREMPVSVGGKGTSRLEQDILGEGGRSGNIWNTPNKGGSS